MPLLPVRIEPAAVRPPPDVRRFLRAAGRRTEAALRRHRVPAFVASDYASVYAALRSLTEPGLVAGRWFCEWGSGLGVVSCLAAMLGFDAWGIEVEEELVEGARRLADDFALPVEFARGSFIPAEAGKGPQAAGEFEWLSTDGGSGYEALGLDVEEFDLVFAYPWPDEERFFADLFERHARVGALFLTYHGGGELRLCRKCSGAPAEDERGHG
jgi:hypothetical protein